MSGKLFLYYDVFIQEKLFITYTGWDDIYGKKKKRETFA